LENLPEDEQLIANVKTEAKSDSVLGMTIKNLSKEAREKLGFKDEGVMVESVSEGVASRAGIRPGDIIMQMDGQVVKNIYQIKELSNKIKEGTFISVLINRQGNPIFLALKK
jgi:Trypsin-like serine proteases, typically periplasmic, contain C-terminal PDZ domain